MIEPGAFGPDRPFPAAKKRALQDLLIEQAADAARSRRDSHRIRMAAVSVAVGGMLAGGGAIAYSAIRSTSVTDTSIARCYTVAEYRSGEHFSGTSISEADTATGKGQVSFAIDVCAALWRAGFLQPRAVVPDRSPAKAVYPVPALVECVMQSGRAAVFPGPSETCGRFGLTTIATRPAS